MGVFICYLWNFFVKLLSVLRWEDNVTEIKYIKRDMIAHWGAGTREVPPEFAKRMEELGVARIVSNPVGANPNVEVVDVGSGVLKDDVVITHESALWDLITWVGMEEKELLNVGKKCGFHIHCLIGHITDINQVLLSDLLIISTNSISLPNEFWSLLKVCMFQKSTRFVMWLKDVMPYNLFNYQLVNRSALNIFENEDIKKQTEERFGSLYVPELIGLEEYGVWREISKLC